MKYLNSFEYANHPNAGISSLAEVETLPDNEDEDILLSELTQSQWNPGFAITDGMLYANIDKIVTTSSEAFILETVSEVLNLHTEGNNDENESKCKVELVISTEVLRAINVLR